jgi:glycosyltransferase involved in cell wall biosynthesis
LDVVGGAEKVILALHEIFPDAPIYTSFVDYTHLSEPFRHMDIRTSYMQRLPRFMKKQAHALLPMDMFAFQDFDLSEYDVVLSSSYVAAKSVLTTSETCHICYSHTPMRFAWDLYADYMRGGQGNNNPVIKFGLRFLLQYFRVWDVQTANNVDYFIANSETVRRRIRKHYRREAEVIYPPVETHRFRTSDRPGDYYLVVSRLVPYKRIDLAVSAFNRLDRELIVIGTGRESARLKQLAGPNVRFLGWQPDDAVARYLSNARGLIFPGEEDFGILPVEAQAAGTPVIAYGKGGALETVRHGETGYLFPEQTPESLSAAVQSFEQCEFDRLAVSAHAHQFEDRIFKDRVSDCVRRCYADFKAGQMAAPTPMYRLTGQPQPGLPADLPIEERAAVRAKVQESEIAETRMG